MHADSENRCRAASRDKTENMGRQSGTYAEQNKWHALIVDSWTSAVKQRDSGLILKAGEKPAQFLFYYRKHSY